VEPPVDVTNHVCGVPLAADDVVKSLAGVPKTLRSRIFRARRRRGPRDPDRARPPAPLAGLEQLPDEARVAGHLGQRGLRVVIRVGGQRPQSSMELVDGLGELRRALARNAGCAPLVIYVLGFVGS